MTTNARVNQAQQAIIQLSNGRQLACEIEGQELSRPPILLVRPLGGSMALWGEFRRILSTRHRVLSFDLRGTGASTHEATLRDTTKTFAEDCVRVLDYFRVPRAHVFGISLGGMTATWLAIQSPARVAKLCLASTPSCGLELTHVGLARAFSLAKCIFRPRNEVEPALVRRILSLRFRREHPHDVAHIDRVVRACPSDVRVLLAHILAGARHDARSDLHRIEAETLVLAGEEDRLLRPKRARALASRIPRASFEVMVAAGHDLTLERPRETATRVAEFVGTHEGPFAGS